MKKIHKSSFTMILMGMALLLLLLAPSMAHSRQATDLRGMMDRAAAAGIDRDRIEQIEQRAADQGVDGATLARLMEPAADLAEQNMPADFILRKIMEGLAKGVPAGRMMPLVESIHQQTPRAVDISGRWMAGKEVAPYVQAMGGRQQRFRRDLTSATLKSLTRQVAPETIESVLNELASPAVLANTSPQAITAAIGILPDLPASVLLEGGMQGLIAKAVKGGFSAADLQKLPGAMNAAERRSRLPAASILEGLSHQLGSGTPAGQILQNLFNGKINAGPPSNIPGRPDNRPGGRPDNGQDQGRDQGHGRGNNGGA